MLRQAPFLKKGNTIGIVCTARKISVEEMQFAIQLFESWGLHIKLGNTIGKECHQFGGTDDERAQDFQAMMDDKDVKAIICARGGYGTIRIMNKLDFSNFTKSPKWIIGYSDITVLHAHINTYIGIQTIHSPMTLDLPTNTDSAIESMRKSLFGESYSLESETHKLNRTGETKAHIVGGNLSLIYAIIGTKSGINTDNKILFIEDLDEYLYHIDRMMIALKRAGKLNKLKGLIVGVMPDMNDNAIPFGKSAEEIISEHTQEFDYPICFDFPSGHIKNNHALVLGKEVSLVVNESGAKLEF